MSVTLACLSIVIVVFIHTGILCIIVGADILAGINWNWINCKKNDRSISELLLVM